MAPFVATFYSFKGGVGRTMALANIAVELALRGRRVLIVDFDLEAPGLDTLPLPKPADPVPGVVDFVADYIQTHETPDFSRYCYEAPRVGDRGGGLWVMPAGRPDSEYADRLNRINWADLYERQDGFLMFEDLKAQWHEHLALDYVLIDSRTGHTDEGGICTRHLPDAVFIFFLPNEQNLRGLRPMVDAVRAEGVGARQKEISLQFVTSNVPDLDDEERILGRQMERFRRDLKIADATSLHTIYRYDSLLLLTQAIFVKERPQSRLAAQYRQLVDRLIALNPRDREGALQFLKSRDARRASLATIEKRMEAMLAAHSEDGEVLSALAHARLEQGRWREAEGLLDQAISLGLANADALLERAELRLLSGRPSEAATDALAALQVAKIDSVQVARAISLLSNSDRTRLRSLLDAPALQLLGLQDRLMLAGVLRRTESELAVGTALLRDALSAPGDEDLRARLRSSLAFNLIGIREFDGALQQIEDNRLGRGTLCIEDLFNSGVAQWALEGAPPTTVFQSVMRLDGGSRTDANFAQCMALAHWASGDSVKARELLSRARQAALSHRAGPALTSCWRYRDVERDAFVADLDDMERFFSGEASWPLLVGGGRKVSAE